MILIPIFIFIFNFSPQNAVATSLVVVFFNAFSGTFAYIKQDKVFYKAGIPFALATIPGAFIGSYLTEYFTGESFRLAFGIFILIIATIMLFNTNPPSSHLPFHKKTFNFNKKLGIAISTLVGFLSSIFGIGGGAIHVPLMIYALKFPTHIATATSHFVLTISSFIAVISHFLFGNILMAPALSIGFGAVIGAQIGAKISQKTKPKYIITLLALMLTLMGIRFIFTAI